MYIKKTKDSWSKKSFSLQVNRVLNFFSAKTNYKLYGSSLKWRSELNKFFVYYFIETIAAFLNQSEDT